LLACRSVRPVGPLHEQQTLEDPGSHHSPRTLGLFRDGKARVRRAVLSPSSKRLPCPIGFVGYGGAGAARAVEQLRLIAIELQMVPVSRAVHIGMVESLGIMQQGKTFEDFPHLAQAANRLLDDMSWWTNVLKPAREGMTTGVAGREQRGTIKPSSVASLQAQSRATSFHGHRSRKRLTACWVDCVGRFLFLHTLGQNRAVRAPKWLPGNDHSRCGRVSSPNRHADESR
jgi:hypothetical protein